MNVIVQKNEVQVGKTAATMFAAQVIEKPTSVLGFATGSSPLTTYKALIDLYKQGVVSFSKAVTFNLDEYVGLAPDHSASYDYFMREELFNLIDIKPENTHLPSGTAKDLGAECARYDSAVCAAGGIDMQLLGIGHNGHIGFNEPAEEFVYGTNVVTLQESTITANERFFETREDVPRHALSMGIGGIMAARKIVLVAMGKAKASIIREMVYGPVAPSVPASILRMHPNVTVILDEEAASLL